MVEELCASPIFSSLKFVFFRKVKRILKGRRQMPGFQEDPGAEGGRRARGERIGASDRSRYEERIAGWSARQVRTTLAFQCLPTNRQELVGAGFSGR